MGRESERLKYQVQWIYYTKNANLGINKGLNIIEYEVSKHDGRSKEIIQNEHKSQTCSNVQEMRHSTFIITRGTRKFQEKNVGKRTEKNLNIENCLSRKEHQWNWGIRILHKTDKKTPDYIIIRMKNKVDNEKTKVSRRAFDSWYSEHV